MAALLFVSALALNDPCNANPDCNSCIKQQYCGWCSTPVIYRDGSPGFQCAGFSVNGSANPFVCHGVYSTVACLPGWLCGSEKYCVPSDPGSGTDKATCEANCSNVGLTYNCDNQTNKCVIAPAGTGGSLDECQKQCTKPPVPIAPATPSAPNAPSGAPTAPPAPFAVVPGTPTDLIGFWRGIQISNGYVSGEFDFRFDNTTCTITDPSGTTTVGQTIQPLGGNPSNQFWINLPTGGTLRFLFEDAPSGPETINVLVAHGPKDGPAPASIVAALNSPGSAAFSLSTCVPGTPCAFKAPAAMRLRDAAKAKRARSLKQDVCSPNPTCSQCLSTPFCGWCSGTVKYSSGRVGAHCVGFDNSTDHFTCNGTYATINCPQLYTCNIAAQQCVLSDTGSYSSLADCETACVTAQTYECNTTSWQCYPTTPGRGSSLPVCRDQCNATKPPPVPSPLTPNSPSSPAVNPPLPPVTPVTPPVLVGVWRGIKIDRRYSTGEWDFVFDMSGGVQVYDHGRQVFQATVGISQQGWLILNITGEVHVANYQVANTETVSFVTLAVGGAGVTGHPPDYNDAMTDPNSLEFVLVKCVASTCVFNPPSRPEVEILGN